MMNKKEIFRKVGGIIIELNEQHEYLSQNPDNLNELELELFAANADFLSDHISILVKLNESVKGIKTDHSVSDLQDEAKLDAPSVNGHLEPETEEEEITIPNWKFELEKDAPGTFDFEEKPADKLFDRPLTEEELRVIDQKTRLKSEPEFEMKTEEPAGTEIQNDEFSEEPFIEEMQITESFSIAPSSETVSEESVADGPKPTINDILSAGISHQSTVSGLYGQRKGKDLKSMISLNDKLLFVRDLFNGYNLAYSEAIELLNRFDSFEAADNFLKQNYAVKNNWADKTNAVNKFYEILNIRFAK